MGLTGKSLPLGTDGLWDLGDDQATVGVISSVDTYGPGIDALLKSLKLTIRLFGLPPEMLDMVTRSETGAARAWDARPTTLVEGAARERVDTDMEQTLEQWSPNLGGTCSFACAMPPEPAPVDAAQAAAGIKAEMQLGLTTPALTLSRRKRWPVTKAQTEVDKTLARNRKDFPELFQSGGNDGGQEA